MYEKWQRSGGTLPCLLAWFCTPDITLHQSFYENSYEFHLQDLSYKFLGVLINRTWYCKQFDTVYVHSFLTLISNTFLPSKGFATFANQIFYILTIMKNIFCQHDVWLDLSRYISCGGARLPLILTTSATIWLLLLLSRAFGTFHITSTAKLYIPSNLNINLMLWYTQLIVCDVNC